MIEVSINGRVIIRIRVTAAGAVSSNGRAYRPSDRRLAAFELLFDELAQYKRFRAVVANRIRGRGYSGLEQGGSTGL